MFKRLMISLLLLTSINALGAEFVRIEADSPNFTYNEGQRAGLSFFQVYNPESPSFFLAIEAYFPNQQTKLQLSDYGAFKYAMTPPLLAGIHTLTVKAYLEEYQVPLLDPVKRMLVETKTIVLKSRVNDNQGPVLSFDPAEETLFFTDIPSIDVLYSDAPAGVDTSTFRANLINEAGVVTNITNLFVVTATKASIQFDEQHKAPAGVFWIEVWLNDSNGNLSFKSARYGVQVPTATEGFLTGVVHDSQGNPMPGATVSVTAGGAIGYRDSQITDAQGAFRIPVRQGGEFLLTATKDGWTAQQKRADAVSGRDVAVETFLIKPLDAAVTAIDKAQGGSGSNSENTVEFQIPPNSASRDLDLNITQAHAGSELPGPLPILSEFTYMGEMLPSGVTFNPAGNLKIKNELQFPAGTDIVFGFYNEATGRWEDAGQDGLVTPDAQFIEFPLAHFSYWDGNHPVMPPTTRQPVAQAGSGSVGNNGNGPMCKGCRIDMETGNLAADYSLPAVKRYGKSFAPTFTYRSQSARPTIFAAVDQPFIGYPQFETPDTVQLKMKVANIYKEVFYQGKEAFSNTDKVYSYRLLMDAKNTEGNFLPTGSYVVDAEVGSNYKNSRYATANYFGGPPVTALSAIAPEPTSLKLATKNRIVVLNSRESAFGRGWTMQGLEKLSVDPEGTVVWEDGSGLSRVYFPVASPQPVIQVASLKSRETRTIQNRAVERLATMKFASIAEAGGDLLVPSCEENQIFQIAQDGSKTVFAGTGKKGSLGDGGPAAEAEFSCPVSISKTAKGEYVIADQGNSKIRKIDRKGVVSTIAGSTEGQKFAVGARANLAEIGIPKFVIEDKMGTIHFIVGNEIRAIDPRGKLRIFVGENEGYYKAALKDPSFISFDDYDNLTIADTGNNRVVKIFVQTGEVRVLAGAQTTKSRGENTAMGLTAAAKTPVYAPKAFFQDRKTQVSYILDGNGSVQVLSADGRLVKTDLKSKTGSMYLSARHGLLGVEAGRAGETQYISPAGDFNKLKRLANGTYEIRTIHDDLTLFNQGGSITSRVWVNGQSVRYTYDIRGKLSKFILPDESEFAFTYDSRGYLTTVTDPASRVTRFTINSSGRVTQIENPDGKSKKYEYSASDLMTKETDEVNRSQIYGYNGGGLLVSETFADGSQRQFMPRAASLLISDLAPGVGTAENPAPVPDLVTKFAESTSVEGRVNKVQTDSLAQVTKSVDALGRTSTFSRDSNGLLLAHINPRNFTFIYGYDEFGQLIGARMLGGSRTQIAYDNPRRRISQLTNKLNRTTYFTHDVNGNLTKIRDPMNRETAFEYNPKGLLTKVTDAKMNVTRFEYNSKGLLSAQIDPMNNRTEYVYDDAGLLISVKDALNRTSQISYDLVGRPKTSKDPMNQETAFTYNDAGELTAVRDAKMQVSTFSYNQRGWKQYEADPLGRTQSYAYDGDGNITNITLKDGRTVDLQYDAAGQLKKKIAPDQVVDFNYDLSGNLASVINADSNIQMTYNGFNMVVSDAQGGFILSRTYNDESQPLTTSGPRNALSYYYNQAGVLNEIQATVNGQALLWNRTMDELYRPTSELLPGGIKVEKAYNSNSIVTDIKNLNQGNEILSRFQFDYSAVNQQIKKTETLGGYPSRAVKRAISNYSYDDSGRLTTVTDPAESFSYDAVGNRDFGAGTSHNAFNQIVTAGSKYSFTYDLLGNMTSKSDLATGEVTVYVWNSESQLLKVQHLAPGGSVVRNETSFKYDGLGRRVSLDFVNNENPSMSYYRKFIYDGAHVIEEQDASGAVVASNFFGPGIDNPIYTANSQGKFVFTKDHQGSIRDVLKMDGTLVQRNRYSAYGVTTQELNEERPDAKLVKSRFGYTGRELDAETGLYYYRTRYYSPELGGFIGADPIGLHSGDANGYSYVFRDPVNFTDPSGKIPAVLVPGLIGGSVGAVAGAIASYNAPNATFGSVARSSLIGFASGFISSYGGIGFGIAVGAGANVAEQIASGRDIECLDYGSAFVSGVAGGLGAYVGGAAAGRIQIPFQVIGKSLSSVTRSGVLSGEIISNGVGGVTGGVTDALGNSIYGDAVK